MKLLVTVATAWLALAAPSLASTLSYEGGTYRFDGVDSDDSLTVAYEAGPMTPAVVFSDATGTVTAGPGLPADCVATSAQAVRCTTLPERVAISGGAGRDALGWAPGADGSSWPEIPLRLDGGDDMDTLRGGPGDDRLDAQEDGAQMLPGLGADKVFGAGTLDLSQDGRTEGVTMDATGRGAGRGPDPGDRFPGDEVLTVRLTEHDDVWAGGFEFAVKALAGDDFVDIAQSDTIDSANCGAGEDLFAGGVQEGFFEDEFASNCESPGVAPGQPAAAILDPDEEETERFLRLNGLRVSAVAAVLCGAVGPACKLTVGFPGYGKTTTRLEPGERRFQLVHRLTPSERARIDEDKPAGRFNVKISKSGRWVNGERYATVTGAYKRILH